MRPGELVAAGRTSDVYEFGDGAVIKVPRPGVPEHWALLEAAFTAAVQSLDVPSPSVIDVIRIDGRHAIVFERIAGRSMWMHMRERPGEIPALARVLAELHLRIFEAGPPAGIEGLVDRVRHKLGGVQQLSASERDRAISILERLPKGAALLHGDLHPGNVLMTDDGPVAIDWFDASIGMPVADVVRSSLLMRPYCAGPERPHLPGADAAMLGELHDSYVEAMSGVLEPSAATVREWEAVRAAGRLYEGSHPEEQQLLAVWRSLGDAVDSPLTRALTRNARACGTRERSPGSSR